MAAKKTVSKEEEKKARRKAAVKEPEASVREKVKPELTPEEIEKNRAKRSLRILVSAVFVVILGIFSAICVYGGSGVGVVGVALSNFLQGCFGGGAYLFPIVLVAAGVDMAMHSKSGKINLTVVVYFVALFLFGAILQMFNHVPVSELYHQGQATIKSGGVISGLLTSLLYNSIGVWGLLLLYIALIIASIIIVCYPSFEAARNNPAPAKEKEAEQVAFKQTEPSSPVFAAFDITPKKEDKPVKEKKEKKLTFREPKPEKKSRLEKLVDGDPLETAEVIEMPVAEEKPKEKVTSADTAKAEKLVAAEIAASAETEAQPYVYPPLDLLTKDKQGALSNDGIKATSDKIVNKLQSFGIEAYPLAYSRGPAVTRYEFALAEGIRISKVVGLANDIALAISASGDIRIEAPIPGKSAIGIEVPNSEINTVYLRSLLESSEFTNAKSSLSFAIGNDISGANIIGDIAKMPHMLIAGATGSGKSVCINALLISLLYRSSPDDVRLIMVDPKMVELGVYNGIPHLLVPVVTDPKKAAGTLSWAVGEMTKRYTTFAECKVKDIGGYNSFAVSHPGYQKMPRIVIVIDELADLMMVAKHEVEQSICRLTQLARAAGMHLVIATQRPSVDVITGLIKANIPSRIAFTVSSLVDSRTILDMGGAEKLLGRGDMLYNPVGAKHPTRVQGCFVSDKEVVAVVDFIKSHFEASYDDDVSKQIDMLSQENDKGKGGNSILENEERADDPMLEQAIECVVNAGQAATSYLQRRLGLGYARAARLIDIMAERGIVGPFQGSKPREVLITKEQFMEMKMRGDSAPQASVPETDDGGESLE